MGYTANLEGKISRIIELAWYGMGELSDEENDRLLLQGLLPGLPPNLWSPDLPDFPTSRVREAFEPFLATVHPGDSTVRKDLREAAALIDTANVLYLDARLMSDLDGWNGKAADAFKDHCSRLLLAGTQVVSLLQQLETVYKAYLEFVDGTRADSLTIADATIDALESFRKARRAQNQRIVLAAAGIVAGALVTAASAGATAPLLGAAAGTAFTQTLIVTSVSSAVGAAFSITAAEIGGGSRGEILQSMFKATKALQRQAEEQGDAIARGFKDANDIVSSSEFIPAMPSAAYQPFNPQDFSTPSDLTPGGLHDSIPNDPLLTPPPPPPPANPNWMPLSLPGVGPGRSRT